MNEKLDACVKDAEKFNVNVTKGYDLRQTPERRSRIGQNRIENDWKILTDIEETDKSNVDNTEEQTDVTSESGTTENDEEFEELLRQFNKFWEDINSYTPLVVNPLDNLTDMTTTAIVTTTSRFVGSVNSSDPDKKQRERYDVDQFLADVDSRIHTRGITNDAGKIKEALLFVDPDVGDAHKLMTSSTFKNLTTYDAFKACCRKIWKPKAYKDKFYNLQQLRNMKKRGQTDFSFAVEVQTAIDRVVEDINTNANIVKVDDTKADIRQLMTYVAYSTIYDSLSPENQSAFKKIPLNPQETLIDTVDKIILKASETKLTQEVVACTGSSSPSSSKVESTLVTSQGKKGNNNNRGNTRGRGAQHNARGQGHGLNNGQGHGYGHNNYYQEYSNDGYQQQSYYPRGRGSRRPSRGRGYNNQGYRPECKKCGRNNHKTHECYYCDYCQEYGHETSRCYAKKRNEKRSNEDNEHPN